MIHVPTATALHLPFDLFGWAAGSALGVTLHRWRLAAVAERIAPQTGPGYFAALVIGAVAAAWLLGSANTLRDSVPALSHTVLGALVGAILGVEVYKAMTGIRGSTGTLFVGPFALGLAIGRWGCLFAGLPDRTYGIPTTLPWGVDLGDGIARHPVQIYESIAMFGFLVVHLVALYSRKSWAFRRSFYALAIWYGLQRFCWEFLKPYPGLLGPLNLFHLLCLGLVCYGGCFYLDDLRRDRAGT